MPAGIAFEFLGVLEFSRSSPSIVSRSTAASFTALNSLRGGLKASSASSMLFMEWVRRVRKEDASASDEALLPSDASGTVGSFSNTTCEWRADERWRRQLRGSRRTSKVRRHCTCSRLRATEVGVDMGEVVDLVLQLFRCWRDAERASYIASISFIFGADILCPRASAGARCDAGTPAAAPSALLSPARGDRAQSGAALSVSTASKKCFTSPGWGACETAFGVSMARARCCGTSPSLTFGVAFGVGGASRPELLSAFGGAGEAVVRPSAEGPATGVRTSGMCSAGFALRPVVVRRGLIEGLPLESGGEGVFSGDKSEPSLA